MNQVKKSKGISGSGICEWGGTLADFETSYYYQIAYDRYFAGISDTVQANCLHGDDEASNTYDEKLGAITSDGKYLRSYQGTLIEDTE